MGIKKLEDNVEKLLDKAFNLNLGFEVAEEILKAFQRMDHVLLKYQAQRKTPKYKKMAQNLIDKLREGLPEVEKMADKERLRKQGVDDKKYSEKSTPRIIKKHKATSSNLPTRRYPANIPGQNIFAHALEFMPRIVKVPDRETKTDHED